MKYNLFGEYLNILDDESANHKFPTIKYKIVSIHSILENNNKKNRQHVRDIKFEIHKSVLADDDCFGKKIS